MNWMRCVRGPDEHGAHGTGDGAADEETNLMPRRKNDVRMLSVPCSADEAQAIEEMKALCGLGSDTDLVRTALWNFSEHLEMNIDLRRGVFDLRPSLGRNGYTTGTQARNVKDATKRGERARAKQKPAADHTWMVAL